MRPKFELADAIRLFGTGLSEKVKLNAPATKECWKRLPVAVRLLWAGMKKYATPVVLSATVTTAVVTDIVPNARLPNRRFGSMT